MKRYWKRVGFIAALVALVGVVGVGTVAFAQSPGDETGWPFNFRERFRAAIADGLGITADEYDAAVGAARGRVIDEALADGSLTEDQATRLRERMDEGMGFGGMPGLPFGRGAWAGKGGMMGGWMGQPGDSLINVAAEQLGMTSDELLAALEDGQSIADLAEAQGIDLQVIADACVAQMKDRLDDAVAAGRITQDQADAMLEDAAQRVADRLTTAGSECSPRGLEGDRLRKSGAFPRGGMRGGSGGRFGETWPGQAGNGESL